MTILTHTIAMMVGATIGWCFIALFVVQPLRAKITYRESEIIDLRKLMKFWHGMFHKEVKINTETLKAFHETSRN